MNAMYDAQRNVELARAQNAANMERLSSTLNVATWKAKRAKLAFKAPIRKLIDPTGSFSTASVVGPLSL